MKIKNDLGLHMRPATIIAKILQHRKSKVTLTYKGASINARSIMSVMLLAAPKNAKLKVEVVGPDAHRTLRALLRAFNRKFGEGT